MSKPISIIVVDDHNVVRSGLTTLLSIEEDISVLAEACDGQSAFALARKYSPSLVLMDLAMPNGGGLDAVERIRADCANTHIAILSNAISASQLNKLLKLRVSGLMLKDIDAEELVNAIRLVAAGKQYIQASIVNMLTHTIQIEQTLTKREKDVIKLLGKGLANKEISNTLTISLKTVKTHVSSILAKLDLQDRTQAAIYAIRHGLS